MSEAHRPAAIGSGGTAIALVAALRAEITDGRLAPGVALRQDELAGRFGTSRIPVREALRALEAEGLVTYSPNRGATVALVSAKEIQEMLEVRIALECHAILLAVPLAARSDIATLRRILQTYNASLDPGEWSSMNWQFHWALYLPSDCNRLLEAIERNFQQFSSAARAQVSALVGKEGPQRDHYELLGLVEDGKAEQAATLLAGHIRETQRSIRATMR